MPDVLHLRGPILAGPDDVRAQAWVVDGTISYAPPGGSREVRSVEAAPVRPARTAARPPADFGEPGLWTPAPSRPSTGWW